MDENGWVYHGFFFLSHHSYMFQINRLDREEVFITAG
jgi:diadenosine tetraphosphatase ApaH/serine/threonine PP2A family protein phosphatase